MASITLANADRIIAQRPTTDGDGVKIKRIAGSHFNQLLDPFLLIDEINSDDSSDYVGGFPPHPHRGFQTFTYMIDGSFHHKDSMGNSGKVSPGGVQWMSAASGVIHSEMPEPDEGKIHGFQLWINLPQVEKMKAPAYRDVQANEINSVELNSRVTARILSGIITLDGQVHEGALSLDKTKATVAAIELRNKSEMEITLPKGTNTNILLFDGEVEGLAEEELAHFGVASEDRTLVIRSKGKSEAKILLLQGRPFKEPIAQYGPFVMNTMYEIEQALQDYKTGSLVKQDGRFVTATD